MAKNEGGATKVRKQRGSGRLGQIRQTYAMTRKNDPQLDLWTFGTALLVLAVFVVIGLVFGPAWFWIILGIPFAVLTGTIVFGRRAERSAYAQIAGQPGAAAAVLRTLRRGWTVTDAVAVTPVRDPRQAAVVHRATGRPGVVLVAEGPANRAGQLLVQEKKKLARIAPEIPVHEIVVGEGEGQVRLDKLNRTLMKLPRTIRPAQASEVEKKLKAMGGVNVPIPKGPMPKSARMPRGR
jgi:hypothetical protein